jgi:Tfp pilus assembly protein PilF
MQAHLNQGMEYYKKGDLAHARAEFEAVHTALPNDLRAAILLAYTYNKMDRAQEAVDLLSPLEAGNEANGELEYGLGYALIQTGQWKEGVSRLKRGCWPARRALTTCRRAMRGRIWTPR